MVTAQPARRKTGWKDLRAEPVGERDQEREKKKGTRKETRKEERKE